MVATIQSSQSRAKVHNHDIKALRTRWESGARVLLFLSGRLKMNWSGIIWLQKAEIFREAQMRVYWKGGGAPHQDC